MHEPILYIMCGLPYSGKTVLARAINERCGFPIVSIDSIREERGLSWERNESVTMQDWEDIFKEAREQIKRYLDDGTCVIFDSANLDRASRDDARNIAMANKSSPTVIFVDIPLSTVMERWRKNQETKGRFHLPEKWLRTAISSYEPPEDDENVFRYTQSINPQEWLQDNFPFPEPAF